MAKILTDHGHLQIYSPPPPPRSSQALGSDSKAVDPNLGQVIVFVSF